MSLIRVFISYSHDSSAHRTRVLNLANNLRHFGIDVELDQYHVRPIQGWPRWCEERLRPENTDFVLAICTRTYRDRIQGQTEANEGRGVYWEGSILYNYMYDEKSNRRFIAILLPGSSEDDIPLPLKGAYYRLQSFDFQDADFENLYRELTDQSANQKPVLGDMVEMPVDSPSTLVPLGPLQTQSVKTTFDETDTVQDTASLSRTDNPLRTGDSSQRSKRFVSIFSLIAIGLVVCAVIVMFGQAPAPTPNRVLEIRDVETFDQLGLIDRVSLSGNFANPEWVKKITIDLTQAETNSKRLRLTANHAAGLSKFSQCRVLCISSGLEIDDSFWEVVETWEEERPDDEFPNTLIELSLGSRGRTIPFGKLPKLENLKKLVVPHSDYKEISLLGKKFENLKYLDVSGIPDRFRSDLVQGLPDKVEELYFGEASPNTGLLRVAIGNNSLNNLKTIEDNSLVAHLKVDQLHLVELAALGHLETIVCDKPEMKKSVEESMGEKETARNREAIRNREIIKGAVDLIGSEKLKEQGIKTQLEDLEDCWLVLRDHSKPVPLLQIYHDVNWANR